MIKSPPRRVEIVKSEKAIRDRSHRRGDDRRGHHFAALNRSIALHGISSAIADGTETPDYEGNQACYRQERKRHQPTPDQAADRDRRCSRSETKDQHDRKGQPFPHKPNRFFRCPTPRSSDPSQHTDSCCEFRAKVKPTDFGECEIFLRRRCSEFNRQWRTRLPYKARNFPARQFSRHSQLHADRFRLGVKLERFGTHLAAPAGLAVAAKR
jgi:hypothetical protein